MKNLDIIKSRKYLIIAIAAFLILVLVFFIIVPEIHSIKINSAAVKNQQAILNYVIKYSSKINYLKAENKATGAGRAVSPPARTGSRARASVPVHTLGFNVNANAKANNNPTGVKVTGSKGGEYLKFISSLFSYFKIGKKQVSKLYSGSAGGKENITVSLKGLSLNQCVNIIYAISNSASVYKADIVSIGLKKNFEDGKLLNLNINMERNI